MLWIALFVLVSLLLYWELIIAEGVHLGPRVVVGLYDLVARRYDRIKKFDDEVEADFLGLPLAAALAAFDAPPKVLDVAAGTGRVARTLLPQTAFDGSIVSTDLSAQMLGQGKRTCPHWPDRLNWLRAPAHALPFASEAFDAVVCLEALEFFPDARVALTECVRVLRPGGLLLITNRVGWEAWLLFGRIYSRSAFLKLLAEFPLEGVRVHPWQVEYDLGWAWKKE